MENETNSVETNNPSVTRAAGIVSIAVMGSRILGLVREAAILYYFPTKLGAGAVYAGISHSKLLARHVW